MLDTQAHNSIASDSVTSPLLDLIVGSGAWMMLEVGCGRCRASCCRQNTASRSARSGTWSTEPLLSSWTRFRYSPPSGQPASDLEGSRGRTLFVELLTDTVPR